MDEHSLPPRRTPSLAAAIALIVLGLVVFVPSGLCTGLMSLGVIYTALQYGHFSQLGSILLPLVIGGPFVAGGAVMLWFGIKEIRDYLRK